MEGFKSKIEEFLNVTLCRLLMATYVSEENIAFVFRVKHIQSTLSMMASRSFEMLVAAYQSTLCNSPEDFDFVTINRDQTWRHIEIQVGVTLNLGGLLHDFE
jgi:hypothetical protein